MQMNLPTRKDTGYSQPSRASVYAMAEPDVTPIEGPTRTLRVVDGATETEIDPCTGDVISERPLQLTNQEAEPCRSSKS